MKPKKYDNFLKSSSSKQLLRQRRTALNYYFNLHNITDLEKYFKDPRLLNKKKEIELKDRYLEDIKEYVLYLKEKKIANSESTFKNYISAVKLFFEEYHIEFYKTDWKKIKNLISVKGKTIKDLPLNQDKIKLALSNADAMLKAFALIIAQSGQREIDIKEIKETDLHLDEEPPRINNNRPSTSTKRRRPHFYITKECKDFILDWKKQKNNYLKRHRKISNLQIEYKENNELFPISLRTIRTNWNKNLERVELNETQETNTGKTYYKYRLYNLKSYFRTYLGNTDLAEYLMGHTNISNIYYKKPEDEIKKDYINYSRNLLLYTDINIEKENKEYQNHINLIKQRIKTAEQELIEIEILKTQYENRLKKLEEATPIKDIPKAEDPAIKELSDLYMKSAKQESNLSNKQIKDIKTHIPTTYNSVMEALKKETTQKGISIFEILLPLLNDPEKAREFVKKANPSVFKQKNKKTRFKKGEN